jgi:hypothetical protein
MTRPTLTALALSIVAATTLRAADDPKPAKELIKPASAASTTTKPVPPKPTHRTDREIEGWTVHVDDRLLSGDGKDLGDRALRILSNRLYDITIVVPADKVARLRQVPIYLDMTHGGLRPAQYHPGAGWLKANGYDPAMAKAVHIPSAADYVSPHHQFIQPWSTLHELAHAYHDQVLGFDEPRVKAAWQHFVDSGKYQKTLFKAGGLVKHYALTNQMEFFAEMTESYFGVNDFYPFTKGELQKEEPELYALLKEIWGPTP